MTRFYSDTLSVKVNNRALTIFTTPDSGKIIYRDKIDTLIGIKHPGIVLGKDVKGTVWVIHNHYQIGCPQIVPMKDFSLGAKIFFDLREVFYDTKEIIKRAIESWKEKKEYSWLFNNCQHFVNKVTKNQNFSEAIDEVSNGVIITGGLISLFGAISGNRSAVKAGLTIGGIGLAGKTLNNK